MSKNIKKGFTIVELLIVIIVIGILAGIVVVTYQGVQNKARTTSAQQSAKQILDKAEVYNATMSAFPADEAALINPVDENGDPLTTALLNTALIEALDGAPSATTKDKIEYGTCTGTDDQGAFAKYWNYETDKVAEMSTGTCTVIPVTP